MVQLKLIEKNITIEEANVNAFYLDMFIIPNGTAKYDKDFVETAEVALANGEDLTLKQEEALRMLKYFENAKDSDGSIVGVECWVTQHKDFKSEDEDLSINLYCHPYEAEEIHNGKGETLDSYFKEVFGEKALFHNFIPKAWIKGIEEGRYLHTKINDKDIYIRCKQQGYRYERFGDFQTVLNNLR